MTAKPKPATKAKRKPLSILPVTDDIIRNPQLFANWIYSHTPLILQELFNALPDAPPQEQLKCLSSLYQTGLSYRPLLEITSDDKKIDTASQLMIMLSRPKELEIDSDFEELDD